MSITIDYSRCTPLERLARHLSAFWLRRCQAAQADYRRRRPEPPNRWDNREEAKAWWAQYEEAMRPFTRMRDRATARNREMICLGLF